MKLAILHHHLEGGGVTQVLADHLGALDLAAMHDEPKQVALCHGGRDQAWSRHARQYANVTVSIRTVPGLDYDEVNGGPGDPLELATRLADTLGELGFHADDTVIHVHNHAIGKNVALPLALGLLARWGYRLLLQIHDFAEDFRPANYQHLQHHVPRPHDVAFAGLLYPQAPHIHYAVLNRRDHDVLRNAGIGPVHLLPNAVASPGEPRDRDQDQSADEHRAAVRRLLSERCGIPTDRRYLLYPVRGIRRKNLGEALLWAALADGGSHVGVTLAPGEPVELASYDQWRRTARGLRLPVAFGVGADADIALPDNFAACDAAITTSIAEGFGFTFLQPNLAGCRVIGRDLPEITADFRDNGVTFPGLGNRIEVPVQWLGWGALVDMQAQAYNSVLLKYDRPELPTAEVASLLSARTEGGVIDFADLPPCGQTHVLARVAASRRDRHALLDANPWVQAALDGQGGEVAANAAATEEHYSIKELGGRLHQVYGWVMGSTTFDSVGPSPHAHHILDTFLRFDRFRPVLA